MLNVRIAISGEKFALGSYFRMKAQASTKLELILDGLDEAYYVPDLSPRVWWHIRVLTDVV